MIGEGGEGRLRRSEEHREIREVNEDELLKEVIAEIEKEIEAGIK